MLLIIILLSIIMRITIEEVRDKLRNPDESIVMNFVEAYRSIVDGPATLFSDQYNYCLKVMVEGYTMNQDDGTAIFLRTAKVQENSILLKFHCDWWTKKEVLTGEVEVARERYLFDWLKHFVSACRLFGKMMMSDSWENAGLRRFDGTLFEVFLCHRGPSAKHHMRTVRQLLSERGFVPFLDC